jgi:uncharacterized protein (TIGR00299 family) protein
MGQRVLLLEPVGGIAGDMFLAAALELGVELAALEAPLRTLGLPGWRIEVTKAERHAIVGTHVEVVVDAAQPHPHRAWADIDALISRSGLPERARARALTVFRLIGEVEAKIHGVTLAEIHFHEVGAVDSIIDICGAAVALELLGDPVVLSAPPPLGSGTTRIAHGVVPVPVPATLELLRDVPVKFEGVGELTTPTGAALLKAFATVGPFGEVIVEKVGYGVGTKDWKDRANVLRASLGRRSDATTDSLLVLECNLDDCSPQVLGHVVERLLAQGALDAWVVPVVMKKGRPGHVLSALSTHERRRALLDTLLEETTTLGVRETTVARTALERRWDVVSTPWGEARVKVGLREGKPLNATPEFEDCRAIAERELIPLKHVQAAAISAWRALK